jgi:hypothetical protein
MSAPAPEFAAPKFNWDEAPVNDAPTFTAPQQEKPRPPLFGSRAKKSAEGNKRPAPRARTSSPKKNVPPSKEGQFTDTLMQMYGMVAMTVGMKDPQCAKVIMKQGEECAIAWDKLAVENDSVRKILFALTNVTGVGAVVAAHVPIAMAIAAHHGPGIGPKVVADDNEQEDAQGN